MEYYVAKNGQPSGPYSPEQLISMGINEDTLVWNNSLPSWIPARQVPEIFELLNQGPKQQFDQASQAFPSFDNHFNGTPVMPQMPQQPMFRPKTWLVESILVTLFCCLPFGIVGIIKASQVDSLFNSGNYDGALQASRDAGKWTKLGFFISLAVYVIYFALVLAGVFSSVDFS